jgi:hypothetical protein
MKLNHVIVQFRTDSRFLVSLGMTRGCDSHLDRSEETRITKGCHPEPFGQNETEVVTLSAAKGLLFGHRAPHSKYS